MMGNDYQLKKNTLVSFKNWYFFPGVYLVEWMASYIKMYKSQRESLCSESIEGRFNQDMLHLHLCNPLVFPLWFSKDPWWETFPKSDEISKVTVNRSFHLNLQ